MQGKPVGSLQIGQAAAPASYVEFSLQSAPQAKPGAQP
jgi:hypothetical protein